MVVLYHDFFLVVYITYLAYAVSVKIKTKKKIVHKTYRSLHGQAKALAGWPPAEGLFAASRAGRAGRASLEPVEPVEPVEPSLKIVGNNCQQAGRAG